MSSGSSTSLDVFTLTATFQTAVTGVVMSDFTVSGALVDVFIAVSTLVYAAVRSCIALKSLSDTFVRTLCCSGTRSN